MERRTPSSCAALACASALAVRTAKVTAPQRSGSQAAVTGKSKRFVMPRLLEPPFPVLFWTETARDRGRRSDRRKISGADFAHQRAGPAVLRLGLLDVLVRDQDPVVPADSVEGRRTSATRARAARVSPASATFHWTLALAAVAVLAETGVAVAGAAPDAASLKAGGVSTVGRLYVGARKHPGKNRTENPAAAMMGPKRRLIHGRAPDDVPGTKA